MSLDLILVRIVLAITLAAGALFLTACGTQPPVHWQVNQSDVDAAIAATPPPDVSGGCLTVEAGDQRGTILQRNNTYPGRHGPVLAYSPGQVLQITVHSINNAWNLKLPKNKSSGCKKIYALIASVAQGLAEGGLGSESPYVCVKLLLRYRGGQADKTVSEITYASASGGTVWWADYSDSSMINAYNRAAYLALVRAISDGLRKILKEPLLKQPKWPMGARWPVCLWGAPSSQTSMG